MLSAFSGCRISYSSSRISRCSYRVNYRLGRQGVYSFSSNGISSSFSSAAIAGNKEQTCSDGKHE